MPGLLLLLAIVIFAIIATLRERRFLETVLTPEELGNYPGPM